MTSGSGTKDDQGKVELALIPPEALVLIGEVFTYGAKKYSPDNWRNGMSWRRMASAALRHYMAWLRGEQNDAESGLPHLAHLGCCVMMLLTWDQNRQVWGKHDDRWKAPSGGDELEVGDHENPTHSSVAVNHPVLSTVGGRHVITDRSVDEAR